MPISIRIHWSGALASCLCGSSGLVLYLCGALHGSSGFRWEGPDLGLGQTHKGSPAPPARAKKRLVHTSSLGARSSASRATARRTGGAETKMGGSIELGRRSKEARGTGRFRAFGGMPPHRRGHYSLGDGHVVREDMRHEPGQDTPTTSTSAGPSALLPPPSLVVCLCVPRLA
jgi:hypothetical protein